MTPPPVPTPLDWLDLILIAGMLYGSARVAWALFAVAGRAAGLWP